METTCIDQKTQILRSKGRRLGGGVIYRNDLT